MLHEVDLETGSGFGKFVLEYVGDCLRRIQVILWQDDAGIAVKTVLFAHGNSSGQVGSSYPLSRNIAVIGLTVVASPPGRRWPIRSLAWSAIIGRLSQVQLIGLQPIS